MSSGVVGARSLYDEDHEYLRETVRSFVAKHAEPNAERWSEQGKVDRWLFTEAASAGLLGFNIPEEYGGGGITDFRFNAVIGEEFSRNPVSDGLACVGLASDIVIPYFTDLTNDEQKRRWLPGIAAGELVVAVAMTEPGGPGPTWPASAPPRCATATTTWSTAARSSSPTGRTPTSWPPPCAPGPTRTRD
ncbi:MAG: acyl-CoA dehydrogenase family protein [Nocardioides sp.]|uniref:acyl-CoA dehydrogenase family protein n=1 Tax=Nocardioides sp. TaxID=35761 RepID=UPI003F006554